MDDRQLFNTFIDNLLLEKNTIFESNQLNSLSNYFDLEIENGDVVKHSTYDWTCKGWVNNANNELLARSKNMHLEMLLKEDNRIKHRSKGQAYYFAVFINNKLTYVAIFSWTLNAILLYPPNSE